MIDVQKWLEELNLSQYAPVFARNDVDGRTLPLLNESDLEKLGVSLGHRKQILHALWALTQEPRDPAAAVGYDHGAGHDAALQPPSPERRQLSVMFCDLVGSTVLTRALDPEDLRVVLRAYQGTCSTTVARFGGFVARYMGDGVMVYFGYPHARENDAERAVRAGLAIIEAVPELGRQLGLERTVELAVRVGVDTGLVVAGDLIGDGMSKEEAVVGMAPNLAARMQALAKPNSMVVSDGTRQVLGSLFDCEDLGLQELKGLPAAQRAWRIRGPSRRITRFAAMCADASLAWLVGREREVERALELWRLARAGDGQVLLLSGEPGIGKSRLAEALRRRLKDEAGPQLTVQCSPLHRNSTLYPIASSIRMAARIDEAETRAQKIDRLTRFSPAEIAGDAQAFALLADLLEVPAQGRLEPVELGPQQRRERTLSVLLAVLRALCADSPRILLIEDAQWIDPTSLELLDRIVRWSAAARILVIVSFRPEFDPPWQSLSHVSTMAMERLTVDGAREMIARLSRERTLPPAVVDTIVERADGIPLFVEELTKAVLDSGEDGDGARGESGSVSFSIPATLQDSLMARLDRLGSAKDVAYAAAVVGREFSHETITKLAALPVNALNEALDRLVDSELVYRHGEPPEAVYVFKHALVRDAAYQSLLRRSRQRLHLQLAEILENVDSLAQRPPYEVLAFHFERGGAPGEAIRCWRRAAQQSLDRSAHVEVLNHLDRALDQLDRIEEAEARQLLELDITIERGAALRTLRGYAAPEVEKLYRQARELAQSIGDGPERFRIDWQQMQFFLVRGDLQAASELASSLLENARRQGHRSLLIDAHLASGMALFHLGEFARARDHLERSVALYDPTSDVDHVLTHGQDPGAFGLSYLGYTLWFLGYPDLALARVEESVAIAERSQHAFSHVSALTFLSRVRHCRREVAQAAAVADRVVKLSRERGFAYYEPIGLLHRGLAAVMRGDAEHGLAEMRAGHDALERTGTVLGLQAALVQLATAFLHVERLDEAEDTLRQLERLEDGRGTLCWRSEAARLRAELLWRRDTGDVASVEHWLRTAMETAVAQGARSLELRVAATYAAFLDEKNQRDAARDVLARALDRAQEKSDAAEWVQARAWLARLSDSRDSRLR